MSQPTIKEVLFNPVFANNPIGLQILGICSALAVTSNLKTSALREAIASYFTSSLSFRRKPEPKNIAVCRPATPVAWGPAFAGMTQVPRLPYANVFTKSPRIDLSWPAVSSSSVLVSRILARTPE